MSLAEDWRDDYDTPVTMARQGKPAHISGTMRDVAEWFFVGPLRGGSRLTTEVRNTSTQKIITAWVQNYSFSAETMTTGDPLSSDFIISHSFGGWTAIAEELVTELGRLPDDWAGPGTARPSAKIVQDIESVVSYLPPNTRRPNIEVDEDSGHTTLCWVSSDNQTMFSLLFIGNGFVTGSYASLKSGLSERPWRAAVTEESKIAALLDTDKIGKLIAA